MMKTKAKGKQNIIITLILLILGLIFMAPIILLVMNSFKPYQEMIKNFLAFPVDFTLDNYFTAIKRMDFFRVFLNSAFVTIFTVAFGVIFSFMAAYGISHIKSNPF